MSTTVKRAFLLLAISAAAIYSIWIAIESVKPPVKEIPLTQYIQLDINGDTFVFDVFQVDAYYDIPTLSTELDTEIKISEFTGFDMKINGQTVEPNSELKFRLTELTKSNNIDIELRNLNNEYISHYYIRTLPVSFPEFTVNGESPTGGYYYFTPFNANFLIKMDSKGEIVFRKVLPAKAFDFKRVHNSAGEVRYTYLEAVAVETSPPLHGVGYYQVKGVVMDDNYRVIDEVPYLVPNGAVPENQPLENHEFHYIDDKHYIVSSYVAKAVTNIPDEVPHSQFGTNVTACILQEIKNDKLIWQWDSTEHPELYGVSIEANDFYNEVLTWSDYAHFNSLDIDPKDGNYICSFRNLSSVIKIDSKTGDIIWILGGKKDQFGLTEEQKFSRQHSAYVTESGSIVLFDNGNTYPTLGYPVYEPTDPLLKTLGVSRVLEIQLDETSKQVISYKENGLEKAWSIAMGSAQQLSQAQEIYLVCWGTRMTKLPVFSEIDFTNNKILFQVTDSVVDQSGGSYRAYKFDS